ncbi:hypothetical protein [Campylobacter jejuni]|uniref:hypothetical protein n=1 Tax=Campylobacter jejuni TaxID=197 RepID=UPI0024DEBC6C|nr:hypothetical protein [Campylobacter jejuni]MDK2068736.1 hypothetical protein [Campylobacter jejuni]
MFKKVILFFLMGFALLQANSLDKCDNTAVVSNFKEKIPSEILKIFTNYPDLKPKGLIMKIMQKASKK